MNNSDSRINETEIYEECHLRLYRISYGILKNSFQAEEVMHDTLLKYFSSSYTFSTVRDRDRWMTRVCVNCSLDQLRKNKREESRVDKSVPVESVAEDDELPLLQSSYQEKLEMTNIKGFTSKDILDAIELLPLRYRLIISLYLAEGYDYQEISMITGLKESTVRSQYVRAKIKIIEILKEKRGKNKKKRR